MTSQSTYFVTANVLQKRRLFQVDKIARFFIEVLLNYRMQKKYLLHEFVVMPDHFHLILTPTGITLERALQLVKGGFSFRLNKSLKVKREVWQPSFLDRRVRDSLEYQRFKDYVWQNPVKRFLVRCAEDYAYSSAPSIIPIQPGSSTSAAQADLLGSFTAGLEGLLHPQPSAAVVKAESMKTLIVGKPPLEKKTY